MIIGLDECVVSALRLFIDKGMPRLELGNYERPLVLGSGNAEVTARILLDNYDAVFANESTYRDKLEKIKGIDGAILISASGGKHAPGIAQDLRQRGLEARLLTCNSKPLAGRHVDSDKIFVFHKQPEPYTYNVLTYMGMILSRTGEDPKGILDYLDSLDSLIPRNFAEYDAFYFLVPNRFFLVRQMFLTKFDELFGPMVSARVYTPEQTMHAKTIVNSDKEMFISFDYDNRLFGNERARFNVFLPPRTDYAGIMAVGYYIIGKIQAQHKPYFKDRIFDYVKKASEMFGQDIKVIVE